MSIQESFTNNNTAKFINNGWLELVANIYNDGLFSYEKNKNGFVRFIGTKKQRIEARKELVLLNVEFLNTTSAISAISVNGAISINKKARFLSGVIDNRSSENPIYFHNNTEHNLHAENKSYVDGKIAKIGNQAFNFPIGNNEFYREISISAPQDSEAIFLASYFSRNSNEHYPHKQAEGNILHINNTEYWYLRKERGIAEVMVTLTWNEAITSAEIINDDTKNIHIVRWDESQQLWKDLGGIVDVKNKSVTTLTQISDFGVFTLAKVKSNTSLPGNVRVYNAISPNQDGINDYLRIEGLENYPNNQLKIVNRWGTQVFKTQNYGVNNQVFKGYANTGVLVNKSKKLATGTYFYFLEYEYQSQLIQKQGYLYINDN